MSEEFDSYETPNADLDYSADSTQDYTENSDYESDFETQEFTEDSSYETEDTADYSEESYTDFPEDNEYYEEDDSPKVLTRDERELLESGYNNVEQQLDVLADDYRDKGLSETEIAERLADDRYRLEQDFLNDAFPGQEVTPHVFNGFRPNGARDMMEDIDDYENVRDRLAPGTESSVGGGGNDEFEEDIEDSYQDLYEESIDGDMDGDEFLEDVGNEEEFETLDATFENEEDFPEDTETTEEVEPVAQEGMPVGEMTEEGTTAVDLDDENFEETSEPVHNEAVDNMSVNPADIDYDSIYEEISSDALAEGFKDVNIDSDSERLNSSLSNFESDTWADMSLDEQKESMQSLADYVSDVTGIENPPKIEYYNNEQEGDYGGYNPETNTLQVNEYMLYNSDEAADTIAHELWHCHQHERAMNPQSALDYQYQHNFENYISPDLDQQAYEDQLVEAEARAFANQFKDRLRAMKG
ncbi:MAG: hypothetical protein J6M16_09440 [Clostridia bacterium]|nr:hypothetical protein [Clostridia bacterium]